MCHQNPSQQIRSDEGCLSVPELLIQREFKGGLSGIRALSKRKSILLIGFSAIGRPFALILL